MAALLTIAPVHGEEARPKRFILVGDSTIARESGYGDALCAHVILSDTCINLARAGRSSASYRREGRWDEVIGLLRGGAAYQATYVLIQFGHNDQPGKPGHSTDLEKDFPLNLKRYVDEARAAGGIPILVTPLTRRNFVDGVLDNNLRPWAVAAINVASQNGALALDLNAKSYAAVQALGQDQADEFAVVPRPSNYVSPATLPGTSPPPERGVPQPEPSKKTAFDRTHLGKEGAEFFARMVRDELTGALPSLSTEFQP
ncbi:Lysophospholipase L1 [Duganella sp. CF402]|nr:lysophospholipase L1-like esterase [Duganella sp. BK701]SEM01953.1 Lysophospholipase L1 [Duganella sp. CF402]